MHQDDINHEAIIREPSADIDEGYGDRPVLLEGFTPVDGGDVIVPVDHDDPESFILALTMDQAIQAFLELADQIGDLKAHELIKSLLVRNREAK